MKLLFIIPLALAGAGLISGCNSRSPVAPDEAEFVPPQFSAKNGLLLPEQTRQSFGLKIVEVAERKLASTLDLELRIYQVSEGVARAGGVVTPEEARQLKSGQTVHARLSKTKTYPGTLVSVSDQLQTATGLTEVLVQISDVVDPVVTGQFVAASVSLETESAVVSIPRAALLQCSDGYSVFTVSGEHLVRTGVKVGAKNDEFAEITDGLYAGDEVVLHPVMSLRMTELAATKGGQACCVVPRKGK